MKLLCAAWLVVGVAVGGAFAQDKPAFEIAQVADGLYELTTDGGGYPIKVIASVGADGLLIVDSGGRSTARALSEALLTFGKGLPAIIINTHSHIEHMGGNVEVGKHAVIIGHRNLRERYLNGLYAFGDFPPEALPNLTFTDSLTVHFNGQDIRLTAFPGAHDGSDIVVWFTRSKVAVVGALCMGSHFPSIDGDLGDVREYPDVTARVLAYLPDDVLIVPGHAGDCRMAEARRFLEMLRETSALVREEMDKGKDLARLKSEDVLAAYSSFESSYMKRGDWLEAWYEAYSTPRVTAPRPYGPVLQAFREQGSAAAVDAYSALHKAHADQYWFDDAALMWMGRRLARLHRWSDAIPFLDRCIAEFPGTEGAAVSHAVLSTVYEQTGDLPKAIEHEKAYLQRHPEDQSATKRLAELEKRIQPRSSRE